MTELIKFRCSKCGAVWYGHSMWPVSERDADALMKCGNYTHGDKDPLTQKVCGGTWEIVSDDDPEQLELGVPV